MVRKLFLLIAVTGSFALSACNTLEGAAEDAESVGDCVDGRDSNC